MIVFKNEGEIDVRSISTFGVSVKEGENPIGFFGTGLKYAIAVLLRTGHAITIYSGEKVYQFGIDASDVRGKSFDFVTIKEGAGEPVSIGFTTELGKTWEVWMAYREIACNCKDEKGDGAYYDYATDHEAGLTQILVSGDKFSQVFANRHLYILEDEPAFVAGTMEVRNRPSSDYYYRGIRVNALGAEALYTYNDLSFVDLTEDRTMKYQFYMKHNVASAILQAHDKKFIKHCILAEEGTFEHDLDYHGRSVPSMEFIEAVSDCMGDRMCKINQTAVKVYRESTKTLIMPTEIVLTKTQKMSVEKALDFVEKIGFSVRDAYPIKFVETMGDGVLGLAKDDTIYIAERVFHLGGTKQLASCLIEEYLHLRHGWADMSREMQSFLFDKLVSVGEEMVGEPL